MVPYCTFMLSTGGKIWRSAAFIGPSRNVGELWTRVTWKKRSPPSQRRPLTHPSWPPCFEAFPTGGTNTVALIASLPRIHYVRRFEDPIWGETTPTSSPLAPELLATWQTTAWNPTGVRNTDPGLRICLLSGFSHLLAKPACMPLQILGNEEKG